MRDNASGKVLAQRALVYQGMLPLALTNSPALMTAACPTTAIRSRWPRALTRNTQNPFSALW